MLFLIAGVVIWVVLVILIVILLVHQGPLEGPKRPPIYEAPQRWAGRQGERIATNEICKVLREDDILLNNISISYDGKPAELDNVIINKYGVFIVEVKNYKGVLSGNEDDFEWQKCKEDDYGYSWTKTVKNPIRQVKRQVYILAKYLRYYGVDVWVEGYAYLLHDNSPVESRYVLRNLEEIDRAIHTAGKRGLDRRTVERIREILE